MPLYTVSTTSNTPSTLKKQIAQLIVNVHCRITGAPETFVNVIFSKGVPLKSNTSMHILGSVRKGRTNETSNVLKQELLEKISSLTNTQQSSLDFSLFEVPAQWVMEGGEILPEPGEEDFCEWLQEKNK